MSVTPARYEVFIPRWRPVLLRALLHRHWAVIQKLKKADAAVIATYCRDVPRVTGKRRVSLRIVLKPRARESDDDNLLKVLLDGLKLCGQLIDDNRRWCELGTIEYERGTAQTWGTWIVLEDVP